MNFIASSPSDLEALAPAIIDAFNHKRVVLFYGEMGAGKTTLIKALSRYLGVEESTTSPTFSIVNEYLSDAGDTLYHFDFYRIENEEEVMDLGYEDYFYSGNHCFIEWPEKIPNLLPENAVKLIIEIGVDNKRSISVVP